MTASTATWRAYTRDNGPDLASQRPGSASRRLPTGIRHVLVDGRFVIEDGWRTEVLAGRSVRCTPR
ncbi:hypothetical protein [Streptomyces sp. NPDC046887]|uniref:hypothetical protein n=1 Tax=Streptomyces sp. NPDC046887 TaxID=3155472 RepID=UPI0033C32CFC